MADAHRQAGASVAELVADRRVGGLLGGLARLAAHRQELNDDREQEEGDGVGDQVDQAGTSDVVGPVTATGYTS